MSPALKQQKNIDVNTEERKKISSEKNDKVAKKEK